jgi:hypothetical protein
LLRCNIAGAQYIGARRRLAVSKQLSLSASFAVFAMAAFALSVAPLPRFGETGAPAFAAAPASRLALPGF